MSVIKKQIEKFMNENADLIGQFVVKVMKYEYEDTGHSVKVTGKIGNTQVFGIEVSDDEARQWIHRILSSDGK